MKVALCLSGIVGGTVGKNGQGVPIDYKLCQQHYKKYVIEPNDCDVFFHTWSVTRATKLAKLYRAKSFLSQPQIDFSKDTDNDIASVKMRKFLLRSKWYSMRRSLELMDKYDKYDCVIVSRFDLMFLKELDVNKLDLRCFYVANYSVFAQEIGRERWQTPKRNNASLTRNILHDVYFIASYDNMMRFAFEEPIDWEFHTSANPHKAIWVRVLRTLGEPKKKVKYWGHRGYDWDLYRWRVCHSKR